MEPRAPVLARRVTFWLFCSLAALLSIHAAGSFAEENETAPRTARRLEPQASREPSPLGGEPVAESARDELIANLKVLDSQAAILRRVVKLAGPSVVHIQAEKPQASNEANKPSNVVEEAGSGVIVRLAGSICILTNRHVVRDSSLRQIRVELFDGREFHPEKVLSDPSTDVAVLLVEANGLKVLRMGDSDNLEIGDYVLAFGSPFGLSHSVTHGIVSAKGRRDLELGSEEVRIQDFIQTDAAINPGNSGGPLLNMHGQIVGINTAIASDSGVNAGIGFSIPINIAAWVGRQLVERGSMSAGYLGVQLDSKFNANTAAEIGLPGFGGARIIGVSSGTPAHEANLRVGDVVYMLSGVRVEDDAHLVKLVALGETDRPLAMIIYRDGKPMTVQVIIRKRG